MMAATPITAVVPPPLPSGGRNLLARRQGDGARIEAVLADRAGITDTALAELEAALTALADTVAARVQAMLDGEPEGDTDIEAQFAGLREGQQVKAVALAARLDAILALIEDAGLAEVRAAWFEKYGALADAAERSLGALGVGGASTLLDTEAATVLVDAIVGRHDDALFGQFARRSATQVLDALHTQVGLVSHAELADAIVEAEGLARSQAMSEAETRIAEADRYFVAVAAEAASDTPDTFLYAYAGPVDSKTRPFCSRLVGRAFTPAEIAGLSNGQTSTPPFYSGGGYRCRHLWVPVLADNLDTLPYARGDAGDIASANAAANSRRRKGKKA